MIKASRGPATLGLALLLCAATLAGWSAARDLAPSRWLGAAIRPDLRDMAEVVFAYATVPRAAAALVSGAALGLGAALFQLALRNPLAVPDTLGVVGGAQLALAAATLWAPAALAGVGRGPTAFAGGCLAVAVPLGLAWRGDLRSSLLLPAGLATSFYASSLATLLILFNAHDLAGLSAWSGGSLAVQDWLPVSGTALVVAAAGLPLAVLRRAMALLDLDDVTGRALGAPLALYRLAALGLGVALTAAVTAVFGPLGFLGIGAALLARAAGARQPGARLVGSAIIGAGLLWFSDSALTLAEPLLGGSIATGSATALAGVPLLLAAASRLRLAAVSTAVEEPVGRFMPVRVTLTVLVVVLALVLAIGIVAGRDASGWRFDVGAALASELPWRMPRTIASAAAGALLAVAGSLLQRVTGNPLASPDMLGLGAGAGLGLVVALLLDLGPEASAATVAVGAIAAGLGILGWALRGGFAPARLLVVGLSLGSCAEALIGAFAATGDPRATVLLTWAAGSTSRATSGLACLAGVGLLVLLPTVILLRRPLNLMSLGTSQARALGLSFGPVAALTCLVAAAATAIGTLVAGPFSFVGLVAPQVALRLGLAGTLPQAAGAALIGSVVMALADTLGRSVDFPWQVPSGLMSALIGAPVLLVMFNGRRPR